MDITVSDKIKSKKQTTKKMNRPKKTPLPFSLSLFFHYPLCLRNNGITLSLLFPLKSTHFSTFSSFQIFVTFLALSTAWSQQFPTFSIPNDQPLSSSFSLAFKAKQGSLTWPSAEVNHGQTTAAAWGLGA